MGNVVSTTNVYSQLGQEVGSPGSGGSAGTKLRSFMIEPGDEVAIRAIEAQGHRFDTGSVKDKAWTSFNAGEKVLTYTESLYPLENIFGASTLTTIGTATKKRVIDVALVGGITPKTWVHQWGDPNDNVNQYGYGLLQDYSEKYDRDSGCSSSGAGIAQLVTTGGTFTATPKQLAEVPVGAADFNIYLDTSGANIGTTQITDEIATVEWSVKGMKDARWAANRAQASFAGHVDTKPKWEVKLTIYEGTVARPILVNLKNGMTYFLRIDAQAPVYIDNYQVLTISGTPTGGTFTLTYKGQTTAAIAYNATASAVQSALVALSTVGTGNATVSGGTGGPYTVTFAGALANDKTLLTHTDSFTGGTSPTLAIVQTANPYLAQRDFALNLSKIAALKDTKGVYGREITFDVIEDATWGHGCMLTSYTAEATL